MANTSRISWLLLVLCIGSPRAFAAMFQGLGDLPGGHVLSRVCGLSADGSVAVGESSITIYENEAFRWTRSGGIEGIGVLGGYSFSKAYGVSADGQVVVGMSDSVTGRRAFRWTSTGGMEALPEVPGPGWHTSNDCAFAASGNGSIIVGRAVVQTEFGTHDEANRWIGSGAAQPMGNGAAYGVSRDGSVIVGNGDGGACRWTSSGMQPLGFLPGAGQYPTNEALAISGDASTIVGHSSSANGPQAFRWTAATGLQGLGDFPGAIFESKALGVSGDGALIVGYGFAPEGYRAFIWDEIHGMRKVHDLLLGYGADLTGWTLTDAVAISDDGLTIVGNGLHGSGGGTHGEAWIAVVPEPASSLLPLLLTLTLSGAGLRLSVRVTRQRRIPR
jgi:probable HAF family extracellular repeat protein